METEWQQFQRVRHEAQQQGRMLRNLAATLRDDAGWDTWPAIRGAQLMAPAADRLLDVVAAVSERYPPRSGACTCKQCAQSGTLVPAGLLGLGIGAVALMLFKHLMDDIE